MDHEDGEFWLLRELARARGPSTSEDIRSSCRPFRRTHGREFLWVVDMPERYDKTIFGLDFEFFDVESDPSGVITNVTEQRVRSSFGGYELLPSLTLIIIALFFARIPPRFFFLPCPLLH